MRVIACGSGMPMPRLKQAAACFLIELGNGDKFIFDMGTGSMERIYALGIPLDYIDKVFLTHLHMDHMGDLPAFYMYGPQNNRSVPLRVWGPGGGGTRPEWGTKAAMDNMQKTWAWMNGTLVGTIDTRSASIEVTEYDWSKVNGVIYDHNGVVIRSIPAIHFEQTASFILEWNGMKLAFMGDSLPNRWWIEHANGADLAIGECFLPVALAAKKWGFSRSGGPERGDDDPCQRHVRREGHGHDEGKAQCGLPLPERRRHAPGRHERRRAGLRRPGGLRAGLHGVERHEGGCAHTDGGAEP